MSIIHLQGLRRTFRDVVAVDQLDLEVAEGEIFGLVGPDGAGKTTTMRMLAGVLTPSGGRATVAGFDVATEEEGLQDHIGYMSQRFGLYPDLTVNENLSFYADIYGVPRRARREKADQLLGFSNLTPFQHRLAGHLSGGMKQKLGLACALIHTPRVLFLDEPTNGVDPVSRRDFWRILYQLVRSGVTIFVSTAYLDEAERCNRVALLHRGKLLGLGTPAELKAMMPGELFEVRSSDPRRVAARLRESFPGDTVGLFGDRVHLSLRDPAGAERRTRDSLGAAGLDVISFRVIEPSLEDVFVSVIKEPRSPAAPAPGTT